MEPTGFTGSQCSIRDERREHVAEGPTCTKESKLDSGGCYAEDLGGFDGVEIFEISQDNDGAIAIGQGVDALSDGCDELPLLELGHRLGVRVPKRRS